MSRDYVTEMRAVLDAETPEGPYYPAEVAEQVVLRLQREDPDLLDGWLRQGAQEFVRQMINQRDRSARAYARAHAREWRFAKAATDGDVSGFLATRYTTEDGRRPPLAKMTKTDLIYVASGYDRRASDNLMEKFFFEALAKKVPLGKTVADVFTEEKLVELRRKALSGASQ